MLKRFLIFIGVQFALASAVIAVVPTWRTIALGLLKREPFSRGMPLSYWANRLRDQDNDVYRETRAAIAEAGPSAVPALVNALRDDDPLVRVRASQALCRVGEAAMPGLVAALDDPVSTVRSGAARALCIMGPLARPAIPALLHTLRDQQLFVTLVARGALGNIGEGAVPALSGALKDADQMYRAHAVTALFQIGPAARGAVPQLAEAMGDDFDIVRCVAADTLAKIGPPARPAAPQLAHAIERDPDSMVRIRAARAFWLVTHEVRPSVPALATLLQDRNKVIRLNAAVVLGEIGRAAVPAAAALRKAASDDPQPMVKQAAGHALALVTASQPAVAQGQLPPKSPRATPPAPGAIRATPVSVPAVP